jgi:hypothetical protein
MLNAGYRRGAVAGITRREFPRSPDGLRGERVLGVSGVRTVRPESLSQKAPNPPIPPNPEHTNGLPKIGDEGFPELVLAPAAKAGQVTSDELAERMALHERVLRAREVHIP